MWESLSGSIKTVIALISVIGGVATVGTGLLLSCCWLSSRRRYVPEDEGAEYDAGIHRVCSQCGCHVSGPRNGLTTTTSLCDSCWDQSPAGMAQRRERSNLRWEGRIVNAPRRQADIETPQSGAALSVLGGHNH